MSFERYYDQHWASLDPYFSHHRQRFIQTWAAISASTAAGKGRVLDVGGVGPLAAYLVSLGWTASETKEDLRGPLTLEAAHFDLVLCTETIEHVKDKESNKISDLEAFNYSGVKSMLLELSRSLTPNGLLLITTPNACSLLTLSKWLHGQVLLMDPQHVREFTPLELERIAGQVGLVPVSTSVVNSWQPDPLLTSNAIQSLTSLHKSFSLVSHGDNIIAVFKRSTDAPHLEADA